MARLTVLSSGAAQVGGSQGNLNSCFNGLFHPFVQLRTANIDTFKGRFADCQFSWLYCKSHHRWHFPYVANLLVWGFGFVCGSGGVFVSCLFIFFFNFKFLTLVKRSVKFRELMWTNPVCLIFTSYFLSRFQDFWWPSPIIACPAGWRENVNYSLNTRNNMELRFVLLQVLGGKPIELSCLLTIPVHSKPRKACGLNSLQEAFSSTFGTETDRPVCTRSCLLNQNNSEFAAE